MKYTVINRKQLPTTLPVTSALVTYLLLDKFNSPTWVWAVAIVLYSIDFLTSIANIMFIEKQENAVFNDELTENVETIIGINCTEKAK